MPKELRKIVLASRNEDKIRELREITLALELPFEVRSSLDYPDLPEVIEDGTTPLGNASRKAIATAAYTGEIAVADDTTLQVRAINGLPDIFAARFAGPDATYADNVELLLELLENVPRDFRDARFECTVVWVDPRPQHNRASDHDILRPALHRWLANPFARAIQVADPDREEGFWSGYGDHRTLWRDYHALLGTYMQSHGADRDRVLGVVERLFAPYLERGRPDGYPENAIQLPDTRLWTVGGPDAQDEVPVSVAPSGMPAEALGRGVNEPVWLEIAGEGRLLGDITMQPLGHGGFGYDAVFRPTDSDRTLAEMNADEKHAISHRGRALRRVMRGVQQAYAMKAERKAS
ncbi:MAG: non-canonical purine NTP pyrophosphatase [Candidatus Krumholzibacteriia bacterium]